MSHERVYSPETSEPFDVVASRASDLVLNKGWTRTPWTKVAVEAEPAPEAVEETARGRGRRRRAIEEAPIESFDEPAPFTAEADEADTDDEPADEAESWRH